MHTVSILLPRRTSGSRADHEAMLAALDDLTTAADRVRAWVTAKHHAAMT